MLFTRAQSKERRTVLVKGRASSLGCNVPRNAREKKGSKRSNRIRGELSPGGGEKGARLQLKFRGDTRKGEGSRKEEELDPRLVEVRSKTR